MNNKEQKVSSLNISALMEIGKALAACGAELCRIAEQEAKIWNTEFEQGCPDPTPEEQPKVEEISKKVEKITFEQLRKALADMSANNLKAEAKTVLKNQGAVKLSDIKDDDIKIAAAYAEAQKILKGA
jgi:hypothetical protein